MYCPRCGTVVKKDGIGLDGICVDCYHIRRLKKDMLEARKGTGGNLIGWILLIVILLGAGYFLLMSGILDELLCSGTYIFGVCVRF